MSAYDGIDWDDPWNLQPPGGNGGITAVDWEITWFHCLSLWYLVY